MSDCAPIFLHSSIQIQAIEGKGNGFRCTSPEGIAADVLLLKEAVFETWAPGQYSAESTAAKLIFRSRIDPGTKQLLAALFPSSIALVPRARCDQIPQTVVDAISIHAMHLISTYFANTEANIQTPPTRAEVLRHYFAVECNSFPTGLLITLSNANHSCNPNSVVFEQDPDTPGGNPVYTLTAKRRIQPGEEITISYLDLVNMVELEEDRQRRLEEHFLFRCACEVCYNVLEPVGLLAGETSIITAPLYEDFVCSAFPTSPGLECSGRVGRLTGVCDICLRNTSRKQLDNVSSKVDRLITSLRRTLLETNAFVDTITKLSAATSPSSRASSVLAVTYSASTEADKLQVLAPRDSATRPSSAKTTTSINTTSTVVLDRVKDAATLKELRRLLKLMESMKVRASQLLHATHIAFGPISACLAKLNSWIDDGKSDKSKAHSRQVSDDK